MSRAQSPVPIALLSCCWILIGIAGAAIAAERPNVLWIMTDEQRTDSIGAYGGTWTRTPALDRLAAAGARFDNALTPSPVCTPARVALMTGRAPAHLGVWSIAVSQPKQPWLTPAFERAGYRTASFGKIHLPMGARPFQTVGGQMFPDAASWGSYAKQYDHADFDVIRMRSGLIIGGRFPEDPKRSAEAVSIAEARRWLAAGDSSKPYFLRLSLNLPHTPVIVPRPFDRSVAIESIRIPPETEAPPADLPEWLVKRTQGVSGAAPVPRRDVLRARQYYYGAVEYVDSLLVEFMSWLGARGDLENTIVVFVSDHGVHLGDFGLFQKLTFFEPSVRVPFMIRYDGVIPAGQVIETPVGVETLVPTVMELAGLDVPEHTTSLAASLRAGTEPPAQPVISTVTTSSLKRHSGEYHAMVRDGDWKLTLTFVYDPKRGFAPKGDGDGFLVNLADDPFERSNRKRDPKAAAVRKRLALALEAHLADAVPEALDPARPSAADAP
jgi:arylsulfatase A-like enzyme